MLEKDHDSDALIPRLKRLKSKYLGCDNIVLHKRDLGKPDKIRNPAIRSKYEGLKGDRRRAFMGELTQLMRAAQFAFLAL